jgi:Flp pilus assembly protein TadG
MTTLFQRGTSTDPQGATDAGTLWHRLRDDRGAMMIEMALGFMAMMLMLLGIMECCMMGYTYACLEDAAREGVRYACVHGTDSPSCSGPSTGCADSTAANVIADVQAYAGTFVTNPGTMAVTVTYPDGASTGTSRVQVSITQIYQPVFHLPLANQTLTVSSSGRIMY